MASTYFALALALWPLFMVPSAMVKAACGRAAGRPVVASLELVLADAAKGFRGRSSDAAAGSGRIKS